MKGLNRTFAGRISSYSPDGFGRDSYISYNNGGSFKVPSSVRRVITSVDRTANSPTKIKAKIIKYTSDGSGRDSYVHCNAGGLVNSSEASQFQASLRSWTPNNRSFLGSFNKSIQKTSWKQVKVSQDQAKLDSRLSIPKRVESFYSEKTFFKRRGIHLAY
jgi:hypothetical protein